MSNQSISRTHLGDYRIRYDVAIHGLRLQLSQAERALANITIYPGPAPSSDSFSLPTPRPEYDSITSPEGWHAPWLYDPMYLFGELGWLIGTDPDIEKYVDRFLGIADQMLEGEIPSAFKIIRLLEAMEQDDHVIDWEVCMLENIAPVKECKESWWIRLLRRIIWWWRNL